MSDQYRTVVQALVKLTTQVRRVADAMETSVVPADDDTPTTGDDARAELAALRRALDPDDTLYIDETVDEQRRLNATIDRLRATLGDVLDQFVDWPKGGTLWPGGGVVARVSENDWDRWDAVRKSPAAGHTP